MEGCDATPACFKKPGMRLAVEVHIGGGHGCGTWDERVAFLDKLSDNVSIQYRSGRTVWGRSAAASGASESANVAGPTSGRGHQLDARGMAACKPVVTPSVEGKMELEDVGPPKGENVTKHKKTLGIAMYLGIDTVDTVCTIKELGRWQREQLEAHMQARKRLVRYVTGTAHYTLHR